MSIILLVLNGNTQKPSILLSLPLTVPTTQSFHPTSLFSNSSKHYYYFIYKEMVSFLSRNFRRLNTFTNNSHSPLPISQKVKSSMLLGTPLQSLAFRSREVASRQQVVSHYQLSAGLLFLCKSTSINANRLTPEVASSIVVGVKSPSG